MTREAHRVRSRRKFTTENLSSLWTVDSLFCTSVFRHSNNFVLYIDPCITILVKPNVFDLTRKSNGDFLLYISKTVLHLLTY